MTPEERHQEVMKSVLKQVQDTGYVLKGGTALLLTRGLDRHSEDLDFDASKKLNLGKRVEKGIKLSGVELLGIKTVKDTDTVQRFKAHYINPENGRDTLLKIETSFRDPPDKNMLETINGILTYKVEHIFDQKLFAAENRTRPRDLYDLAHLVEKHGSDLSDDQITKIESFSNDITSLEHRYEDNFQDDELLSSGTATDAILRLREAIEVQEIERSLDFSNAQQNSYLLNTKEEDHIMIAEMTWDKMTDEIWKKMNDQEKDELKEQFPTHEIAFDKMTDEIWDKMTDDEMEKFSEANFEKMQDLQMAQEAEDSFHFEKSEDERRISDIYSSEVNGIAQVGREMKEAVDVNILQMKNESDELELLIKQYNASMLELRDKILEVHPSERPELQSAFSEMLKKGQPILDQDDALKLSLRDHTTAGLYNSENLSVSTTDKKDVVEAMPSIVVDNGIDCDELAERFVIGANSQYLANLWMRQDLGSIATKQGLDLKEPKDFEIAVEKLEEAYNEIEDSLVRGGWYEEGSVDSIETSDNIAARANAKTIERDEEFEGESH